MPKSSTIHGRVYKKSVGRKCMWNSFNPELYKVKEVQLKFNSRWLTARATKVQFICQKLNFNFSQLMDELFWVATQMKFRENEVPPAEREEELSFFLVMTTKYCSSFSFYRGTLLSLWTSFELQLKKVNQWVGQKLKFSFCPMNWALVDFEKSRK